MKWNRDEADLNEQSIFTSQKENRASSSDKEGGTGVFRLYGAVHTYEEYTSDDFLSNMSSADVRFYDVGYKTKRRKRKRSTSRGIPLAESAYSYVSTRGAFQ